jgi:hypothetical protein
MGCSGRCWSAEAVVGGDRRPRGAQDRRSGARRDVRSALSGGRLGSGCAIDNGDVPAHKEVVVVA